VFILHPGFLNREPGPDFRQAIVQVGDEPARQGDIEVDPHPADWLHHQHAGNPAYADVLLHVVWQAAGAQTSPARVPLLEIEPALDAPIAALQEWLCSQPPTHTPPFVAGKCSGALEQATPQQTTDLLQDAALFRLHRRAERIGARAHESGWTQALWEGAFRALGYKHNSWPMLRLAELRPRFQSPKASQTEILARLLGTSGLLPSEARTKESEATCYLRRLWDSWWRERDAFADCAFPRSVWRRAGIRPANHPQRRLVLAAEWLSRTDLAAQLTEWCNQTPHAGRLATSLRRLLEAKPDPFWLHHYTLHARRSHSELPLLGTDRVTDLAGNIILPWLWARAQQGRRPRLCREIERRYLSWPAGSDNAVLRQARLRLLGRCQMRPPRRMALQQGLLQIASDHCDHSNSLCEGCRFPEMVPRFLEH
jgi:hypothetical protein